MVQDRDGMIWGSMKLAKAPDKTGKASSMGMDQTPKK
jgi:hypothetical protein